jgi:hypothetical protein
MFAAPAPAWTRGYLRYLGQKPIQVREWIAGVRQVQRRDELVLKGGGDGCLDVTHPVRNFLRFPTFLLV